MINTEVAELSSPEKLFLAFSSWREGQRDAIEWLRGERWLEAEADIRKIKVLEAPTGTGKTGIILGLAELYPEKRFLILCATKLEQEQYQKHLLPGSNLASVKGKNNFHCAAKHPEEEEECEEYRCWLTHANEAPCSLGEECSVLCRYRRQKIEASNASIVVTNYAYGLAMLNYIKEPSKSLGSFDVIVSDEGHVLDLELEKFIQIPLSRARVQRLFRMPLPFFKDGGDIPRWKAWVEDHWDIIEARERGFWNKNPNEMSKKESSDAQKATEYSRHFDAITQLSYDWVVEDDKKTVRFLPVWVTGDSEKVLFQHANRHIVMSGTIPSARELGKKVGISAGGFEFLRLPYTFPPENRPIVMRPRVSLSFRDIEANLPLMVEEVDRVLEDSFQEKEKKVLIHTKNYRITEYLARNSRFRNIILTHKTEDRNRVLEEFRSGEAPLILSSPSFDKAVDLPGEQCELIIIVKIPYPYLGSKVMKRRVRASQSYYVHETLMSVIQMAGRGVRNEVDVCPTVVLDALGPKFLAQARKMIPRGIAVAIREER